MSSMIGTYTGFHTLKFSRQPCSGGDCLYDVADGRKLPRSKLALINHSYWSCKECTRACALKSLADTIRSGDKQRLQTGLRLERMYRGEKYVPLKVSEGDAKIIKRFKELGGKVSNAPL